MHSLTSRILGYLNILGHFNSEINTVIQTAWKKGAHFGTKNIKNFSFKDFDR